MTASDPGWELYRTFLAVLREGSLSGAARSLGLTQPTIGRHIDALEQAVGFQLFTRSQHGLAPTEAAAELRPYAEELSATALTSSSAITRGSEGATAVPSRAGRSPSRISSFTPSFKPALRPPSR